MNKQSRLLVAVCATIVLFVSIQLGALVLIAPFDTAGMHPVEDPDDPTNPLLYIVAILIATGLMLAAFKFGLKHLVRGGVILASTILTWIALTSLFAPVYAIAGAAVVGTGLYFHPEWYIIDIAGVLIGSTAAGLFGLTFGILPALLLLVGLSIYDAISVYGTKHMLSLADGVMDVKIPVLLIVPLSLSYSFLDDSSEEDDHTEDALFIGLGDAIIPAILVSSVAFYVQAPTIDAIWVSLPIPAFTAMIGTIIGLLVLLRLVIRGRPHAGLPLLCGGAIVGYLAGSLLIGIPVIEAIGLG